MSLSSFGFSRHHVGMLCIVSFMTLFAFFDFLILWHFSDLLSTLFFSNLSDTKLYWVSVAVMFIVGYLVRPVGGYLLGRHADKKGRKPALLLAFFATSVFTLLIGLLPIYEQIGNLATVLLLLARIGQGIAFAAVIPLAWIYISESLPLRQIGLGSGIVCIGITLALLATAWLAIALNEHFTQADLLSYGWRLPFIISGTLGLLLIPLRQYLSESPVFIEHRAIKAGQTLTKTQPAVNEIDPLEVMAGHIPKPFRGVLPVLTLSWFVVSVIVFNILLLPLLGLGIANNGDNYLHLGALFGLLFFSAGCVFFGFLSDRMNISTVITLGCIALVLSTWGLFRDLLDGGHLTLLFFVLTGFSSGVIATAPALMVRLCPVVNRALVLCVIYNIINAIIGSGMPLLLGFATFHITYAPVMYLTIICMITVFFSFFVYDVPRTDKQLRH